MSKIGDNSGSVDAGHLLAFIERIETLEENKREILGDIKEVYSEADGSGYDIKIIRKIVSMRRVDVAKRREEEAIIGLYLSALGMLADAPLGDAAMSSARHNLTVDLGLRRGGGA